MNTIYITKEDVIKHIEEHPHTTFLLDLGAPHYLNYAEHLLDENEHYYIEDNTIYLVLE